MAVQTLFGDHKSVALSLQFTEATASCQIIFGEEINEALKFNELVKTIFASKFPLKRISLDLRRTIRINSQGAKGWLIFIREAQAAAQVEFDYLSEPLVELASMWPGVLGSPRVAVNLLEVPYSCPICHKNLRRAYRSQDIHVAGGSVTLPPVSCDVCKKPMDPDVIPEEYFGWMIDA
jgi:hypothetical protein